MENVSWKCQVSDELIQCHRKHWRPFHNDDLPVAGHWCWYVPSSSDSQPPVVPRYTKLIHYTSLYNWLSFLELKLWVGSSVQKRRLVDNWCKFITCVFHCQFFSVKVVSVLVVRSVSNLISTDMFHCSHLHTRTRRLGCVLYQLVIQKCRYQFKCLFSNEAKLAAFPFMKMVIGAELLGIWFDVSRVILLLLLL